MELASQECCLHHVLFTRRYVTFVLVISNKKCLTKVANIGLMIKDQISFDKLAVATHFNQFFSNIADKLVSKLPPVKGIYGEQFVKSFYKTNSTLSLKLVTADNVLKLLSELNSQKATGLDGLPARQAML